MSKESKGILYLCCAGAVLILYWAGFFRLWVIWLVVNVPFPHSERLLQKFLAPECSMGSRPACLQMVCSDAGLAKTPPSALLCFKGDAHLFS
jgi:hypothetical protein